MKNAAITLAFEGKDKHYLWYPVYSKPDITHQEIFDSIDQSSFEFDKARINISGKVKTFIKTGNKWHTKD